MAAKTPPTTKTVDGLLKALLVLSRTVDHVLEIAAVESAVKQPLSASKVQTLRLLGNRGGQTASQIARFLGVSKPAVTQLIDSMVRARLVVRRASKADRREIHLQLTKKGRQLHETVRRSQRHYIRNTMGRAGTADAAKWVKTLQGIAVALVQANQTFEDFCAQCGAHEDGTCVLGGGHADCLFAQKIASDGKWSANVPARK
jgi:DNA-binding MarR family transcriptional regulator